MGGLVASLGKNRRLLSDLVSRDLRARYVGSSMGFFWSVLFPVINLAVYMFVFRIVLKMRWSDQQGTAEVSMLMLAGILVWHAFAESTSRMTNALVENQNLIQKVVFPSEVLPVYLVISSLVNMLIGLVIALFAVGYFAYVRPEARPGDDEKPVALWSAHAGETPRAGNGVVKPGQVRCATRGPGTEVAGLTIVDRGEAPWTGSAASAARYQKAALVKSRSVWAIRARMAATGRLGARARDFSRATAASGNLPAPKRISPTRLWAPGLVGRPAAARWAKKRAWSKRCSLERTPAWR